MTSSEHAGDTGEQDPQARNPTVFRRGEIPLAHTVYGLILTLATVSMSSWPESTAGMKPLRILGCA